ncbi:MAG: hypothetical protein RR128_09880 [Clostridium sp.]
MEEKMYHYKVYGINIDSQIEIPEFPSNKKNINNKKVDLILGKASDSIKEEINKGSRISVTRDNIWFHAEGVATYMINNGNEVIVEPCENYDEKLLKVYIMGSVMGFLLLQQQVLAIHGGTTVINDKAVIFTGDRGAGKSTLTTALGEKGYKFLADDVAAIRIDEVPQVNPGFPYHKLCEDAVDKMNYDKEKLTHFRGDGKVKYLVPDLEGFSENQFPLKALFEISVGDVDSVQLEEVYGQKKFYKLLNNIYRNEYMSRMGEIPPMYFKQCMEVAKSIKCYTLIRPKDKFTVEEQIRRVEEVLAVN